MTAIDTTPQPTNAQLRRAERVARFERLVAILTEQEISRRDISKLLGMKEATARKYLNELREHEILESRFCQASPKLSGHWLYWLVRDEAKVQAFLDTLASPEGGQRPPNPLDKARGTPGRSFHFAEEDRSSPHRLRSLTPPARDPLVWAMFGAGRAAA